MRHPSDPRPRLLVVIATYNEIDNLPRLVGRIETLLPHASILIIDDGSPDGTGRWCDQATEKHPQLTVIHREDKQGLGSAAQIGFQYALEHHYELIATLDADFSHDPESLVELVATLEGDTEHQWGVAIGSRYIAGGEIKGWPLHRRLASRAINRLACLVFRLKTRDNSGAFRVYRAEALQSIDLTLVESTGYAYLEEILWRLQRAGVSMIEIPITFRNRLQGTSKTSLLVGFGVAWQIVKLGIRSWSKSGRKRT